MSATKPPNQNHILAGLPEKEYLELSPHLKLIELSLGEVIYKPNTKRSHVYFPTTAIVSMLHIMENGDSGEFAVIGNEGIVGVTLFMGSETTINWGIVQSAGYSYQLPALQLITVFERYRSIRYLLLRYTQSLLVQMAQTAVCNRHHTIDQQFCRWLLMSLDRLPDNHLVITQELIANILGVRRESVSKAANSIQSAGLIKYHRGHITVIDRDGVEKRVCECYAEVKKETSHLLS